MRASILFLTLISGCAYFLPSPDKSTGSLGANQTTKISHQRTLNLLHYNIKELTTQKLLDPDHPQIKAIKQVLTARSFDIMSINEMQYDLPGVPSLEFTSQGENLGRFMRLLNLEPAKWGQIFAPANTGSRARRNEEGEYYSEESAQARTHADPLNYGLFPAQYSTAGIFRDRIIEKTIIHDLRWREFNPTIKPATFSLDDGRPLPPDIVLFDKTFNHVKLDIDGKTLHVILLHTVPSFHFGNNNTPNYARNADQLRFLEWYITGKTSFPVPLDRTQWPMIHAQDGVVVMGDLNADINQPENMGAVVLRRIMKTLRPWKDVSGHTNESAGFHPKPLKLTLDYILVNNNIEILEGGVVRPEPDTINLGCDSEIPGRIQKNLRRGRTIVDYYERSKNQKCFSTVNSAYYVAKTASDHFPIYAKIKFR